MLNLYSLAWVFLPLAAAAAAVQFVAYKSFAAASETEGPAAVFGAAAVSLFVAALASDLTYPFVAVVEHTE